MESPSHEEGGSSSPQPAGQAQASASNAASTAEPVEQGQDLASSEATALSAEHGTISAETDEEKDMLIAGIRHLIKEGSAAELEALLSERQPSGEELRREPYCSMLYGAARAGRAVEVLDTVCVSLWAHGTF